MLRRIRQLTALVSEDEVFLTPRSEKVVQMACLEARQLGHDYVDTEHLLLGLVREFEEETEAVGARVLADLGVSYEEVLRRVSEAHGADE